MNRIGVKKLGWAAVLAICALITIGAFFANRIVLFQFNMMPSDYTLTRNDAPPEQARTKLWFAYGADREVQFGTMAPAQAEFYAMTMDKVEKMDAGSNWPFKENYKGYITAILPPVSADEDGDGLPETVFDSARADFGPHAYGAVPRAFHISQLPFEVSYEERKFLQVFFEGEPLAQAEVYVTTRDYQERRFTTDSAGYISDLPVKYIRSGLTVSYSPQKDVLYRMYYALEDYDYFSPHFWKAQLPLLIILAFTAAGIVLVEAIRRRYSRNSPAYRIYSREKAGLHGKSPLMNRTSSKFLLVRWVFLIGGFILWTYAGKITASGQVLNQIAIPTFSCPFNLDQTFESGCYYLTHLLELFTTRSIGYIAVFLLTLFLCIVFLGRILCGFMCPLGFVQDLMDKLRQLLHITPITVSDRMNRILQPLKWTWIILFLCFAFTGGNFCEICPNKVFSPALGGYWIDLVLGGILTIPLLVGSFFIKRFWCIICPMGYILGLFHKWNIFKLKKDCTACTECRACYAACPMRIKGIYTEREKKMCRPLTALCAASASINARKTML